MLIYDRPNGNLLRDTLRIGKCYSGSGAGLDNPKMEAVHNIGPIPAGDYRLERCSPEEIATMHKGPDVYRLVALDPEKLLGRSGFMFHWDNKNQDFSGSEGCILPLTSAVWQRIHDGDMLRVL